ncbi:MAG: autotransporter-associated beta strand repeat-containing protein, partial [Planctomycetia bacterium]|nr:autotransporter-associated beta strand repeat-containing protein [Planctomycetia bacterium]
VQAENVSLTGNQANEQSWNDAATWSNNAKPSADNDYFVIGHILRTPQGVNETFGGKSLTLGNSETSGELILKMGAKAKPWEGVVTINDLRIVNGSIGQGVYRNSKATLNGNITVSGNAYFKTGTDSGYENTDARSLIVNAPISGTGTISVSITGQKTSTTLNGVISGDLSLVKIGDSLLTLTGENTYTGGTTISDGTIKFTNNKAFGTSEIKLEGGTISTSENRTTANKMNFKDGTTSTLNVSADGTRKIWTISGNLTGNGNVVISKSSGSYQDCWVNFTKSNADYTGKMTVQGRVAIGNTYNDNEITLGTQAITLSGGILLNHNNNVTLTNDIVFDKNGGTLRAGWNGKTLTLTGNFDASAGNISIAEDSGVVCFKGNTITGGNGKEISGGAGVSIQDTITVNVENDQFTWRQPIKGTGGIKKIGNAALVVTGNENTYTGGTRIEAGTVRVKNHRGLAEGVVTMAGGILQNYGTSTEKYSPTLNNKIIIEAGNIGKFMAGWNAALTLAGDITANGDIAIMMDSGTVKFSNNTISTVADGANTVNILDDNSINPTAKGGVALVNTVTANVVGENQTINWQNVISGDGTLKKTGVGTLTISGANTFTGGIELNAGTLKLANANAAGTGGITITGKNVTLDVGEAVVPLTIASTGTLSLDDMLTITDFTWDGTWLEGIASTTDLGFIDADNVNLGENVVLSLDILGFTPEDGNEFTILTADNYAVEDGFDWNTLLDESLLSNWNLGLVGNLLTLAYSNNSGVPEPATWVMLALGMAGIVGVRRFKK